MSTKAEIKNTGATFTPRRLAELLSEKILANVKLRRVRVLDPACGEGELLVAVGERLAAAGIDFELTGYDASAGYLEVSRKRLSVFTRAKVKLIHGDFLDLPSSDSPVADGAFDIVIANPPYVRTQALGSDYARRLASKFDLKGRVDLYYPFLKAMTGCLNNNGVLGVITSNRFLFTKSGEDIRKYLSESYSIIELLDLGDTRLFEAAVLPAIFIGRKSSGMSNTGASFSKVYEELNGFYGVLSSVDDVYEIINAPHAGYFLAEGKRYKKTVGVMRVQSNQDAPWELLSEDEAVWISTIEKNAGTTVGDLFNVRVGIKTTADKVFISEDWDRLGIDKPENELLKDLISQENVEAWRLRGKLKSQVLYPHYHEQGVRKAVDLDNFPRAKKHLLTFEDVLKSRKYLVESGRKWFEIWVPHRPELWSLPKLVFPDISASPRFCFDDSGKVVNGNCYWIVAENKSDIDKLLLIQGVANSKLMTRYHDLVFNNKLYAGRRRYLTQYVGKYPLPDPSSQISKEIVSIVRRLNDPNRKAETTKLLELLEEHVAAAFGVPTEVTMVV